MNRVNGIIVQQKTDHKALEILFLGCYPLLVCSIKVFTDLSDKFPFGGGKGQACGGGLRPRGLEWPLSAQLGTSAAFRNGQEKTEH